MSKDQRTTDNGQRTRINVLFVCMGNICRSPMAEAVFKDLVAREGLGNQFHIESVGTDAYHVGEPAHQGTRQVLAEHGIRCDSTARQITRRDLERADYIIALDRYNASDLQAMLARGSIGGHLGLLLSFAEGRGNVAALDVPDPYYTGNFEEVYRLVEVGCQGLLAHIRRERGI
jgi:protein-tyrosine phosphatase